VEGDSLICVVGGEGSHAVAFDLATDKEKWRSLTAADQGYSPPTIIEAGGKRQLMLLRPDAVTSVDPANGEEYWSVPYEGTNGQIIMSPVVSGDYMFVGGYNNQNLLLKRSANEPGAEIVWGNKSKHGSSPIMVQPFVVGDAMFGCGLSGNMTAVALLNGERLWETADPIGGKPVECGTAFIVKQSDRFWLFNE